MSSSQDQIIDVAVDEELKSSFLSYAMSVVVSRALPDVRDGLKPVHRRLMYVMSELNLQPSSSYVKCARVVGDVMGKYHPHGDSAIYGAMVRMAQDWAMRVPLVDGHGNFGTHTDPPAAMRYTEARMSRAALPMVGELGEDTVDFGVNYDGKLPEPKVLPAGLPNLLVNGSVGLAVGMSTNMPPHNLGEVVAACQYVLEHEDATIDDVMRFVPGPDLPTGGILLNLAGVREAYRTGKGRFTMRARTQIVDLTARKRAIIVTELPYQVGQEHVIEKIKEHRAHKRLQGVAAVTDLTDRKRGLYMVIECKAGYDPEAVLQELFRRTPLQTSFSIHNLALVDGRPRTLTLLELVGHYVQHRVTVTQRRCEFRRARAQARAHLLEGYLVALAAIEEVVRTIRGAKDTAEARTQLVAKFALDETQASAILEMALRRLTGLEVDKITAELTELTATIAELTRLLSDPVALRGLVSEELGRVVDELGTPRRSTLSSATVMNVPADVPAAALLQDEPCQVTLTSSGLLGRWGTEPFKGARGKHDALLASLSSTVRATIGLVTTTGRVVHASVAEIPSGDAKGRGGAIGEFVPTSEGERVVGLIALGEGAPGVAVATRGGIVKVLTGASLPKRDGQALIAVKDQDEVVAVATVAGDSGDMVFVTSDAQLLRTPVSAVRPQGAAGSGVAGVRLGEGARVVAFTVVAGKSAAQVVTVTDGQDGCSMKVTPVFDYPAKGRATAGVRCQRFGRGETRLVAAGIGVNLTGVSTTGALVKVPTEVGKRDGSGVRLAQQVVAVYPLR